MSVFLPTIVMAMHHVAISMEDIIASATQDLLEMERIAQILMNVQRIEMIAMQMPHVQMWKGHSFVLATQDTREMVHIV